MCVGRDYDDNTWETACGLTLDEDERKERVLADEWNHVTCKACRSQAPEEPEEDEPVSKKPRPKNRI